MTPERLAKLIPLTLQELLPPEIESRSGRPIKLCAWLNHYACENLPGGDPLPLGALWPAPPRIAANHYSLAQAPLPPTLYTSDCGPVQFCNRPGADPTGQHVPALDRCQRVSDHVIASSGEVAFARTDLTLPGPLPFHWQRYYRRDNAKNCELGRGWRHSLSESLHIVDGDPGTAGGQANLVELHTAEGRVISFTVPPIGHSCYNRFERLLLYRQSLHSYRLSGFDQPEKVFRANGISNALPLTEIRDRFGNSLTVDYRHGLPGKIVSSWGRVLEFVYSGQRLEKILNRHAPADDQVLCSYEYDESGEHLTAAGKGSARESYRYDNQQIVTIDNNQSGEIEFSYDDRRRCNVIRRNQLTLKLSWRPAQQRCTLTSADRHPTHWKFDKFGQLVREEQHDRSTRYFRDHYGNLCQRTGAGQRNIYRYDEFGRLLRYSRRGVSDRYVYDECGLLIAAQLHGEQNWKFAYGERGLPERVTDPDGYNWQLRYNERGQLIQLTDPEGGGAEFHWDSQAQLGEVQRGDRRWTIEYDHWQRPTAWTHDGEIQEQWHYGSGGELLSYQSGETRLRLDRDSVGRPCGIHRDGEAGLHWQCDANGNVHQINLPDETEWRLRYDAHDRIVQVTNAANRLQWHYDAFGQLGEYAGARGDRSQWQYDSSGRVREYRDNDTHWYFLYCDSGALRQIRNNSGQQCEFHFDTSGRLVQAENGYSRVGFQYDRRNLLLAEHHDSSDDGSLSINHQYDGRGWLKRSTSENLDLRYLLSPDAGLYGVDANGEAALRCEHLGTEEHWAQGRTRSRRQYLQGQLIGIETADNLHWQFAPRELLADTYPAQALENGPHNIERDTRGNIIREQRTAPPHREYLYQYDGWGLMGSAECGDFKTYFRYDPFGRRLAKISTHRKSTRRRHIGYRWYSLGLWRENRLVDDRVRSAIHYLYHPLRANLLSQWQSDTLEHYLVDPAGAPLALFDHSGAQLWPDDTSDRPKSTGGPRNTGPGPWRGARQMADSETGLHYCWRGYWHPLLNGWLHREDPLGGNHLRMTSSADDVVAVEVAALD